MRELAPGTRPCRDDGTLDRAATGFAKRPFGPVALVGHRLRKKRWDYWCITTPRGALSIVVADVDYLGLAAISHFAFDTRVQTERANALPLGVGCRLSDVWGAPVRHRTPGLSIDIVDDPDGTRIRAHGRAAWGDAIEATLWIEPPGETLNIVVPMAGDTFQVNAKHAARRALGDVRIGDRTITLGDDAFAARDWGRGVWPYATRWNWACASGVVAGKKVGLNLGGAWTDGTGVTENAITIDGRVHVIGEDLRWTIDRANFAAEWRIRDGGGKVDVRVRPFWPIQRRGDIGLLRANLDLVWARFYGTVEADDGARIELDGMVGWAEEHTARW